LNSRVLARLAFYRLGHYTSPHLFIYILDINKTWNEVFLWIKWLELQFYLVIIFGSIFCERRTSQIRTSHLHET
jgi:hypothetical protein